MNDYSHWYNHRQNLKDMQNRREQAELLRQARQSRRDHLPKRTPLIVRVLGMLTARRDAIVQPRRDEECPACPPPMNPARHPAP